MDVEAFGGFSATRGALKLIIKAFNLRLHCTYVSLCRCLTCRNQPEGKTLSINPSFKKLHLTCRRLLLLLLLCPFSLDCHASRYAIAAPFSASTASTINGPFIWMQPGEFILSLVFFFFFFFSTQVDLSGGLGPLVKHERLPSV